MDKILRNALACLGCDEKEIRLYIACYMRGTTPLSELTKLARLKRSTTYMVAKSLIEKGLLVEDNRAYGKHISAAEPETLMRMVASRQRQIGRQRLAIEENLGELQALHQTNEIRPRVRTYQGVNGLLSVLSDILQAKGELLIWTNQLTESKVFTASQHEHFIRERLSSELSARVLAVHNPAGHRLQDADEARLRETRILPEHVDFSAETYIYGHKIAMLDFNQDIIGIIIENEQLAAAQRAVFELAWQQADYSGLLDK